LREEKDDNKNGSPEEIYDPVCPEKLVCVWSPCWGFFCKIRYTRMIWFHLAISYNSRIRGIFSFTPSSGTNGQRTQSKLWRPTEKVRHLGRSDRA
jgi:hypothetical protein